ncbi:hypothetical protein ACQP2K_23005 [Microbispora siamensis]
MERRGGLRPRPGPDRRPARLFPEGMPESLRLEPLDSVSTPAAEHLTYRVIK